MKWLLLILLIQAGSEAAGQSEIGVNAGANRSGFYQFKSKERGSFEHAHYKHHIGYTTSVFYKEQVSRKTFSGFELENMQIRSDLASATIIAHASYTSYDAFFHLNYINLHFLYGGKVSLKKIQLVFEGSPYIGFIVYSKAKGQNSYTKAGTYIDSLGHEQSYLTQVYEDIKRPADFIKEVNIGLRLSVKAVVPVNEKVSVCINAADHFGIYNVSREESFIGITGYGLTAGLIWNFEKRYLNLSKWEKYTKNINDGM